jgi:hypothetical protein
MIKLPAGRTVDELPGLMDELADFYVALGLKLKEGDAYAFDDAEENRGLLILVDWQGQALPVHDPLAREALSATMKWLRKGRPWLQDLAVEVAPYPYSLHLGEGAPEEERHRYQVARDDIERAVVESLENTEFNVVSLRDYDHLKFMDVVATRYMGVFMQTKAGSDEDSDVNLWNYAEDLRQRPA